MTENPFANRKTPPLTDAGRSAANDLQALLAEYDAAPPARRTQMHREVGYTVDAMVGKPDATAAARIDHLTGTDGYKTLNTLRSAASKIPGIRRLIRAFGAKN